LARLLREVASGSFPASDGEWVRVSPWIQSVQGIVSFTGHAVLAVAYDIPDGRLRDLGVDGVGGATHPRVLTELAGPTGWIGALNVLMLGRGAGAGAANLVTRHDLAAHPLAQLAHRSSQDVQVLGRSDEQIEDLVILSRGVAGVREIAIAAAGHGPGHGAELIRDALACVPEDELVVASVPPGNAAALRAALDADLTPVGAVQLFSSRPERRA
jgi:hypothetical protein